MQNQISQLSKIILLLLTMSLLACTEPKNMEEPTPSVPPNPAPQKVVLEGDDVVLARVNEEPITLYELEQTIRSTLGAPTAARLDESGRRKVLESLVASRAIALAQEAQMTAEELAAIDKRTRAYREQLLVKQYLAKHVSPQPVTSEMVRNYYKSNPEQFGRRQFRKYKMITGQPKLKSAERDSLIALLGQAAENTNWQNWVTELEGKGYPVSYRQGLVTEKVLHPRLEKLMKDLNTGESSNLIFIKGVPYVVKIVEDKQLPPQPLDQVSDEIRKALVPVQLKKSVKLASEQVLAQTDVVYEKEKDAEN